MRIHHFMLYGMMLIPLLLAIQTGICGLPFAILIFIYAFQ